LNRIHRLGQFDKKIQISTTKGLKTLPIEIQSKSSQEIIDYIIDLLQSSEKQVYRSKLMVVGYERIGKTTLLDCLLPLTGYFYYAKNHQQKKYWFKLQGKYIHRFKDDSENELIDEIVLENKQWKLNILSNMKKIEDKECSGFELIRDIKPKRRIEYYFENESERHKWIDKLNRLIENKSTHGIDIQNHKIKPKGKEIELDISVWDFAGQHEYYNNHHYFLSTRSLFLVCWKMDEGEKGLEGLKFWLKSLKFHLGNGSLDKNTNKPLFSIFIVGTHLDHYSINQDEQSIKKRKEKIQEILNELDIKFPIEITEVSSMNLENIEDLQTNIWETISNHSYMGERVPSSYLTINDEIQQMKQDFGRKKYQDENGNENEKEIPIIELTKFQERIKLKGNFNMKLIKRGLNLLTMWGECGFFGELEKLSDTLVYELKFLTKQVMAQLFRPEHKKYFKHGILKNKNLKKIWKNYSIDLIQSLFELMEKFDVCFKIDDKKEKNTTRRKRKTHRNKDYGNGNQDEDEKIEDFFEGKSIIPSYLKMKTKEGIEEYFPFECPYWMIEKSRILKFEVIPQELISRILVNVQSMTQEYLIWRNGIYFDEGVQLKCLLICSIELNQLEIKIRGINFQIIKNFIKKVIRVINESLKKYSKEYNSKLSKTMEFEIKDIKQAFAIDNSELRKTFSIYRKNTLAKQKETPDLFNKDDWKSFSNPAQRLQFYNYLDDLQNKFEWNSPFDQVLFYFILFYFIFILFCSLHPIC